MNHNQIELAVLVKGRPITEYNHRGQVFIEGRAESEYEIEIRNNSYGRVEAVLSVDGMSVIDGKAAGVQSSGYLIEARQSIRIPGWTLDKDNVAKFAFSGKGESYATQMTGDARNNGVIGVMAFAEKSMPPQHYQLTQTTLWNGYNSLVGSSVNHNARAYRSDAKMFGAVNHSLAERPRGIAGASSAMYNMASPSVSATTVDCSEVKTSGGILDAAYNPLNVTDDYFFAQSVDGRGSEVQSLNSLGTAFGEAAEFATTKVEFTRGDLLSMMVLYYDEARGLKARGIQMVRPSKKKYQSTPDAFPAMAPEGCTPPPGWKG